MGGTCCVTREKNNYQGEFKDDFQINEVQKSLLFITEFFDKNRETQILALCYSKDQLKNFMVCLSQIMSYIKTKTGKIFVPASISNNPMNPEFEMLICLVPIEELVKYRIDMELSIDESLVARQFVTRKFSFQTSDPGMRKEQLKNDLMQCFQNEGLMIIGGVQEPGKLNTVNLLLIITQKQNIDHRCQTRKISSIY
ncbi:UNKNOWN [Stylonychia lemnae]|uniref:Uncharacterized protein n=1 Tax=Stylonychia lemnae TaxID=5949 RepID=A0A077ZXH1_STYLE|nr:UNKNOWN [Stylonychia lemnae]|eukprot:CDW73246.1 UNKNOWN [Stylonychia lemnae]